MEIKEFWLSDNKIHILVYSDLSQIEDKYEIEAEIYDTLTLEKKGAIFVLNFDQVDEFLEHFGIITGSDELVTAFYIDQIRKKLKGVKGNDTAVNAVVAVSKG